MITLLLHLIVVFFFPGNSLELEFDEYGEVRRKII